METMNEVPVSAATVTHTTIGSSLGELTVVARGEAVAGERRDFSLRVEAAGSAFQQRVWDRLARIPYGTTVTYGELAKELGDVVTAQEVGAAVGRNPVSIVIPCHRVVGANGALTGYAGGLRRKRALLDLEQDVASGPTRLF